MCNDGSSSSAYDGALASLVAPPSLTAAVVRTMVPQHHWRSSTCSHNKDDGGGGSADNSASASSVVPSLLAWARMEVVAVQMMVLLHCLRSIACFCNDCGGSGVDGGALILLAVLLACMMMTKASAAQTPVPCHH